MFTRKWAIALIAVSLALPAVNAFGAPYVYVSVLGRIAGSSDTFSSVVAVNPGQNVEYQLVAEFTDIPATNASVSAPMRNLTSFYYGKDGMSSLYFNLYQTESTSNIQTSLSATTLDMASWGNTGLGSSGGVVTAAYRATGTDVQNIRPVANTGQLWGVSASNTHIPVLIGTGNAAVTSMGTDVKAESAIKGSYSAVGGVNGGLTTAVVGAKILGTAALAAKNFTPTTAYADPGLAFNDLVLYQPWAEADILGAPVGGYVVDPATGESLTLTAAIGGSTHTTATYHWTINSGDPLEIDTLTPGLTLTNDQLNALLLDGPNHLISLNVTTGDGQGASSTPIPLTLLPEPATMALLGLGLFAAIRRRRTA